MHRDVVIDQMIDEIARWRTQSKAWEQLAHQFADALIKQDDPTPVLTSYNRQVRAKYRAPRSI